MKRKRAVDFEKPLALNGILKKENAIKHLCFFYSAHVDERSYLLAAGCGVPETGRGITASRSGIVSHFKAVCKSRWGHPSPKKEKKKPNPYSCPFREWGKGP